MLNLPSKVFLACKTKIIFYNKIHDLNNKVSTALQTIAF